MTQTGTHSQCPRKVPSYSHPTGSQAGPAKSLKAESSCGQDGRRRPSKLKTNWRIYPESSNFLCLQNTLSRAKTLTSASIDDAPNRVVVPLRDILWLFKVPGDNKFNWHIGCSWNDSPGVWHLRGTRSSMSSTSPTAHNSGWRFQHRKSKRISKWNFTKLATILTIIRNKTYQDEKCQWSQFGVKHWDISYPLFKNFRQELKIFWWSGMIGTLWNPNPLALEICAFWFVDKEENYKLRRTSRVEFKLDIFT